MSMGKENAPVFILVGALSRIVVVIKGQVETGIEKFVATCSQQPDSVVFTLPDILLVIEQVQPNIVVKW